MLTTTGRLRRYRHILENLGKSFEPQRVRRIFANRDLNLARIGWVGFDMDYTLAIYRREVLDELVHGLALQRLVADRGYPDAVLELPFDASFMQRGLTIDKKLGHVLKVNGHLHVARGSHGLRRLTDEERRVYRTDPPRFSQQRYVLVDTLFHLPEAYLFAALVDFFEKRDESVDFGELVDDVRVAIDTVHADGSLKTAVLEDLPKYVFADPQLAPALHRFRSAGKRLFLLTNSHFPYTNRLMSWLLDGVEDSYPSWTGYFDVVITGARKPGFFRGKSPFALLGADGSVERANVEKLARGGVYEGGNLRAFQAFLGVEADEVLYIGDHLYGDILRSKQESWRTAMIVPEIEDELRTRRATREMLWKWSDLENDLHSTAEAVHLGNELLDQFRQALAESATHEPPAKETEEVDFGAIVRQLERTVDDLRRRERELTRAAREQADELEDRFHPVWGSLFKQGNEHSIFGQQLESYACVYTSKASNFLAYSPLHYFRSPRDVLPHEIDR